MPATVKSGTRAPELREYREGRKRRDQQRHYQCYSRLRSAAFLHSWTVRGSCATAGYQALRPRRLQVRRQGVRRQRRQPGAEEHAYKQRKLEKP